MLFLIIVVLLASTVSSTNLNVGNLYMKSLSLIFLKLNFTQLYSLLSSSLSFNLEICIFIFRLINVHTKKYVHLNLTS